MCNTYSPMERYLASLSDERLMQEFEEAKMDSAIAAATQRGSPYHCVCGSAVLAYAFELERRENVKQYEEKLND